MEFKSKLMCGPTVIGRWKYETHELEGPSNHLYASTHVITLNGVDVEVVAWPHDQSSSDPPRRAYVTVKTPIQLFPVLITEDFPSHHTGADGTAVVVIEARTTYGGIKGIIEATDKGLVCVNDSPKTFRIHTWTQVGPPTEEHELPLYSLLLEEVK